MDKKKLIAAVIGIVLAVAGLYFGIDIKGSICGAAPDASSSPPGP